MFDLVPAVADWLAAQSPYAIWGILFLVTVVENILPIIPGDTFIVLAGSIAGLGIVGVVPTLCVATVGGIVGFVVMYELGKRAGNVADDPNRLRWVSRPALEKMRRWLRRWGYGVVGANRFLSGARSVVALAAGISELDRAQTILWASVSAFVWTLLLVVLGYELGTHWTDVVDWLQLHGKVVTGGILVLILGYVLVQLRRRVSRG